MAGRPAERVRLRTLLGWLTVVMVAGTLAAGMTLTIWIDLTWPGHTALGGLPAGAGALFTLGAIIFGTT